MMLLDTSFIVDLFKGSDSAKSLLRELKGKNVATTVVSLYEILSGTHRLRLKEEEKHFSRFFSTVRLLSFDRSGAEEAARIMGDLMRVGKQVNALDTIIAGIAIANQVEAIITRDADFLEVSKVADIVVKTY